MKTRSLALVKYRGSFFPHVKPDGILILLFLLYGCELWVITKEDNFYAFDLFETSCYIVTSNVWIAFQMRQSTTRPGPFCGLPESELNINYVSWS